MVVASSSGGTQAGMAVGAWAAGFAGQVHGISIDRTAAEFQPALAELATQTASLLGVPHAFTREDFIVHDGYLGGGYGVLGDPEREAIRLLAAQRGAAGRPGLHRPRPGRAAGPDPPGPVRRRRDGGLLAHRRAAGACLPMRSSWVMDGVVGSDARRLLRRRDCD